MNAGGRIVLTLREFWAWMIIDDRIPKRDRHSPESLRENTERHRESKMTSAVSAGQVNFALLRRPPPSLRGISKQTDWHISSGLCRDAWYLGYPLAARPDS